MNTTKVQQIINQLIEEKQKQIRYARQYPVAKKQIAKLEELGILNLMPAKFGYTDADVVITAATNAKTAVMNASGEGEELSASDLYAAINEKEIVTAESIAAEIELDINDDDFQNAERAESINDAVVLAVRKLHIEDSDERQELIEQVINIVANRYSVIL